jgi:hypothetical protein
LFSRVAALAVSFSCLAEYFVPQPLRAEERLAEVATLSWPPPTLAIRVACLVLTVTLRRGTLPLAPWKAIVPAWLISPRPRVGSRLPEVTGRVMLLPLRLAPAEAVRVTPSFFRKEEKTLSIVSLVCPEPTGS